MSPVPTCPAFISMPGTWEWVVIALFGLLLFGKRLPEVGKSLGKSIVEFKKGLAGIEDNIDKSTMSSNQADMLPPPGSSPSGKTQATQPKPQETVPPASSGDRSD